MTWALKKTSRGVRLERLSVSIDQDAKFRNRKGHLTYYALACGYVDTVRYSLLHQEYVVQLYHEGCIKVELRKVGFCRTLYEGQRIGHAHAAFRRGAVTMPVCAALIEAGQRLPGDQG